MRIASIVPSGIRTAAFNLRRGQALGGNAGCLTSRDERLEVVHVLVLDRYEQPVVQLEAAWADTPQDQVLLDALDRRLAVAHRVPRTAVQQSVVASGRARGHFSPFHERDLDPAQCQVMSQRASGTPSAHYQDVGVVLGISHLSPPSMIMVH